jgi:hypothetical protein
MDLCLLKFENWMFSKGMTFVVTSIWATNPKSWFIIIIHGFSKGSNWLTSLFLRVDMYILTIGLGLEWHVYFLLVNLIKLNYFIICQIEHLIKLNKKNDHLGQNDQWLIIKLDIIKLNKTKMSSLVKMDNGIIVKWDILWTI